MRRLTKLQVLGAGLKGWVGSETLSGCDVFAGPNGVGKTTRLLAVVATIHGLREKPGGAGLGEYLGPERPKAVSTLTWDDGQSLGRNLDQVRGRKRDESDARAAVLVGRAAARYDLADFAADTDSARSAVLRGLLQAGGAEWSAETCRARLATHPEDLVDGALALWDTTPDVGPWLEAALEWARYQFTAANAAKVEAENAALHLEQHPPVEAAPGRLRQVQGRQAEVDAELQRLAGAIATAEQGAAAIRHHQAEQERLVKAVSAAEAAERQAREEESQARAAIEALAPLDEMRAAIDGYRSTAALFEVAARQVQEKTALAREELAAAREMEAGARAAFEALEGLQGQAGDAVCRLCGGVDPLGLGDRVESASAALAEAQAAIPPVALRLRLAERRASTATAALADARQALQAAERELSTLSTRHDTARATLARAATVHDRVAKTLDAAEVDLTAHRDQDAPPGSLGGLETLQAQRAALEQERMALRTQAADLARAEGGELTLQQAIEARERASIRWREIKDFGSALRALQVQVAAGAYAPITAHADRLLSEAGVPLRVYFASEADYGGIKLDCGGLRVHFASLSDGERALVGASLAYAFAMAAGSPCPMVILDRLEAIDRDRYEGFLAACAAAVKDGRLANFVGAIRATTRAQVSDVDGVAVHWLEKQP